MITHLFEKKDDHMKTVTFVLDWTAITVYEIREVALHYLFKRSPGNIFTLHFGSSGRVKQRETRDKGSLENKNMQLQRNNNELRACHEIHAIQLLPFRNSLLFVNKQIKSGKETDSAKIIAEGDTLSY